MSETGMAFRIVDDWPAASPEAAAAVPVDGGGGVDVVHQRVVLRQGGRELTAVRKPD